MDGWRKTGCNFCGAACGLEVKVIDNHIVSTRPDPDNVRTPHSYCCRKGRTSKSFQENPERLDYPLKKVGDHFECISWDQAYTEIAEKANDILEKHGPRSFAYCGGALANDQADVAFGKAMAKALGSQYVYNPAGIEFAGNWWSHGRILGHQGLYTEADDKNIDVMLFWGSNSYVSHQIQEARSFIKSHSEAPDKAIVVIDPRLSETARMADLHVMPRAGSDSLLLRGMISLIIEKGWQDQAYLNTWCSDWQRARAWFEGFDYKSAFEVCCVPQGQMEEFCRLLTSKTWGLHQDLGIFCGRHNTLNSYLLLTLMAVTGNLQVKGNVSLDSFSQKGPPGDERDEGIWRTVETNRFPVTGVYPCGVMGEEMLSEREDRLRMMFMSMANPARSWPDTKKVEAGLKRLELLVVIDIVMTESAQCADYVLPGKTGFEAPQWSTFQVASPEILCFKKQPVIGQIGEREENGRIWLNIMKAMGRIPQMDQSIYDAAVKCVEKRDAVVFFPKFLGYMKKHAELVDTAPLMMVDALSRPEALGSVSRSFLLAALAMSPLSGTGACERAGFKPSGIYKAFKLLKKTQALSNLSVMSNVFWAVDEAPSGVVIGYSNPDPIAFAKEHIFYPDKKIRLFDETIDAYIKKITPDREAKELLDGEFPLILSSGNHADGGDNTSMRNPDTYKYRRPYTLLLNPEDAQALGISNGEEVRLVTRGGKVEAPVEYSWKAARGYCLIPHHYGLKTERAKLYGRGANELTRGEDIDEISGNPLIRFVPCRVEKLQEVG